MPPDLNTMFKEAVGMLSTLRQHPENEQRCEAMLHYLMNCMPEHPWVLFGLGALATHRQQFGLAAALFQHVLSLKPDAAEAWNNLGHAYDQLIQKDQAMACYAKALEMEPENADFLNNMATAYVHSGKPEEALPLCAKALALTPDNPHPRWNRSLAYLELARWGEGWDDYEAGYGAGKRIDRNYSNQPPDIPIWDGTPGKTVAVWGEQGVGDEIMFASMIPDIARQSKLVIMDTHPRLTGLFRNAFGRLGNVLVYGTRKEQRITWPSWHKIDYRISIASLGRFFRRDAAAFQGRSPYLIADPDARNRWADRLAALGPKPKIGISWKGGTVITRMDLRRIQLPRWQPIFDAIDADWISLQYTPESVPFLQQFCEESGRTIHHWQDCIDDLDDSYGGLINALDLIITVPQSVMHAAGAMGVPCWVMTPRDHAWQMGTHPHSKHPYYDSLRLFWQQEDRQWDSVIAAVAAELPAQLQQRRVAA